MATAKAILATTMTTVGQWHPQSHEKTKVGSAAATARQRGGGVGDGDKSESDETMSTAQDEVRHGEGGSIHADSERKQRDDGEKQAIHTLVPKVRVASA